MSTTITDPVSTEQALTLPPELWRRYRDERRMGSKQREATSHAFEKVGIQKSDTRERLRELLLAKESADGLALTSREIEDEIEREAEGGVDVPAEPEPGSLGAIQADARERLETLREQRARLAPEALVDAAAKAEMANLEDEIRAAETALDLVEVARGETGRREYEASEAAARAVREQGEAEARELQPQIHLAAVELDAAAHAFAERAAAYRDLKEGQAGAVGRSGRGQEAVRGRSFRRREVAAALNVAMSEHGIGGAIEGFEGNRRDTSMAACEAEEWS
jgi:hypothetical protein